MGGDWEGLFIDGELVTEGHNIGEGSPEIFWLDIASKYKIISADLMVKELIELDDEELAEIGTFPKSLSMLKGDY